MVEMGQQELERDELDVHEYIRCAVARIKVGDYEEANAFFYHALKVISTFTHFCSDKMTEKAVGLDMMKRSDENKKLLSDLLMERYANDSQGGK
jgi:hypothetical protein